MVNHSIILLRWLYMLFNNIYIYRRTDLFDVFQRVNLQSAAIRSRIR